MASYGSAGEWEQVVIPDDLGEDGRLSYIPQSRMVMPPSIVEHGNGEKTIEDLFETAPLSVWAVAKRDEDVEQGRESASGSVLGAGDSVQGEGGESSEADRLIETVIPDTERDEASPQIDFSGYDTIPSNPSLTDFKPEPSAKTGAASKPPLAPQFAGAGEDTADSSPFHAAPTIEIKPPQYLLYKKIGEGGCGEVWRARQASLGRLVAVKKLKEKKKRPSKGSGSGSEQPSPSYVFRQEAVTTALLEHPNIIPVHDLGEDHEGNPLLAMKLVRGEPWDKLLRHDLKKMEPEALLAKHLPILVDVSQAVAFAHSMGVVHRDLKPGQVMIGEFGETLLMDWGLSLIVPPEARPGSGDGGGLDSNDQFDCDWATLPTRATASNPAGTPFFMAPEQTRPDASDIGTWTDIYLLGGTLYYILSGHYPHESVSALAALKKAAKGVVEPPENVSPNKRVPADLSRLAMHALEKEPNDRVPSARAFIRALEDFLSGASNRRESQQLTEDIEREFYDTHNALSYRQIAQMLGRVGQAQKLWPANELAAALNERLHADYAQAAISAGDLNLAQTQIDILEDSGERELLQSRLDIATKKRRVQQRQQRVLIFGSTFFLICIVVGSLWFAKMQNQLNYEMNERMKELSGIYSLSDIIRAESNLDEAFGKAVNIIPPAWQYPEITTARLTVDGVVYESDDFSQGAWSQSAKIIVEGEERGLLEVFYTQEKPEQYEGPFFKEERELLDRMATMISGAIVRDAANKEQARILYDMLGRAKMLNCIYGVTDAIGRYDKPADLFKSVIRLMPPALQYPEITEIRIRFKGEEFLSADFTATEWILSAPIMADRGEIGAIDICYLEARPEVGEGPFLFEERDLIDRIAILLAEALEDYSSEN